MLSAFSINILLFYSTTFFYSVEGDFQFKSMVMRLDPYESEGEKSMQLLTVQKAARGGNSSQAKSPELVHDDGDLSCEQQTPTESVSLFLSSSSVIFHT